MGRKCSQCKNMKSGNDYSTKELRKGDGISRCRDCTIGHDGTISRTYTCQECSRNFSSENQLEMHMQTHRPKTVSCPVCGEERFRSGANVVQHFESGSCTGCSGKSKARKHIYDYALRKEAMTRHITELPLLTSDGNYKYNDVPDLPYHCPDCKKYFRHCSQLLQHNDNKHGKQTLLLGR